MAFQHETKVLCVPVFVMHWIILVIIMSVEELMLVVKF